MKNTLVRLKVRREVVRVLTDRDLAIAVAGGADNPNSGVTDRESGCRNLVVLPTG